MFATASFLVLATAAAFAGPDWEDCRRDLERRRALVALGVSDAARLKPMDGCTDGRPARSEPTRTSATRRLRAGPLYDLDRVTSRFGRRIDPVTPSRGYEFHQGIDIDTGTGDPLPVLADGVVTFAGRKRGYGLTVIVEHASGLRTLYAHASKLLVEKGQRVRRGATIALSGDSGRTTGDHLHLGVIDEGRFVDPMTYLLDPGRLNGASRTTVRAY